MAMDGHGLGIHTYMHGWMDGCTRWKLQGGERKKGRREEGKKEEQEAAAKPDGNLSASLETGNRHPGTSPMSSSSSSSSSSHSHSLVAPLLP